VFADDSPLRPPVLTPTDHLHESQDRGGPPGLPPDASALRKNDTPASPPHRASAAGAAVSVSTVVAQQRDYPVQLEATGTVTPLNLVEVKPQISSTITKVHIREGQFVQAGQLLFTLDARSADTDVAKAQGAAAEGPGRAGRRAAPAAAQPGAAGAELRLAGAVDQNRALFDSAQAVVAADRARCRRRRCRSRTPASSRPARGAPASSASFPARWSSRPRRRWSRSRSSTRSR
jgi:multidrug efflux pump subunit AcrA (membrane-fusion protein)